MDDRAQSMLVRTRIRERFMEAEANRLARELAVAGPPDRGGRARDHAGLRNAIIGLGRSMHGWLRPRPARTTARPPTPG
jgi:hypothetical protein